MTSSSVAIGA